MSSYSKKKETGRAAKAQNSRKKAVRPSAKNKKKIGTENESSLHRTLKFQYTGHGGRVEVDVGEFVADGIRADGEYIEVQTGSFAPLRKKIKALNDKTMKIRIIHPIAVRKTIEVYNTKGKLLYRRKSPKKGSIWNLFDSLIYAPELALLRSVTIEVVLVEIKEKRFKDGKGSWRRKGISIKDKELMTYREKIVFKKKADYLKHFVPFKKGEEFTSNILAARTAVTADAARKALYVFTKMNVVERITRKGRSWVYCLG